MFYFFLCLQITIQHQEMHKLQEERDRLQDQAAGTVGRDEVIEQARKDRDDATEKWVFVFDIVFNTYDIFVMMIS